MPRNHSLRAGPGLRAGKAISASMLGTARKFSVAVLGTVMVVLLLAFSDSSSWPHFQTLLSSSTSSSDPQTNDVLFNGMWFWPAKGVGSECNTCMSNVLKQHHPWNLKQRSYAEDALSCVYTAHCRKAATAALIDSLHDSDPHTSIESLSDHTNAMEESPEQMMYTAFKLDRRQYDLNWKRAQAFTRVLGGPSQNPPPIVLTEWVPPLDPVGRPVPSWLTFKPVDLPPWLQPTSAANAREQELAEYSAASGSTAGAVADSSLAAHGVCVMQGGCGACVAAGCGWCGTQDVCAVRCAATSGAAVYHTADSCLARSQAQERAVRNATSAVLLAIPVPRLSARADPGGSAALASVTASATAVAGPDDAQERNALALATLVRLSRGGAAGATLSDGEAAEERRMRESSVYLRSSSKAQVQTTASNHGVQMCTVQVLFRGALARGSIHGPTLRFESSRDCVRC